MEMKGEYRIPAPRERVWAMLNDADVLRQCIPGCESLDKAGEDKFAAKVTTKIGPVKATFTGEVALTNINAPESYTIGGEGKGGAAGFARGSADVHLAEDGSDTILTYTADAKVGGKLAQLGSRLIDSTAKKLADQFFDCFAAKASGVEAAEAAAPAEALGEEPAPAREDTASTPPPAPVSTQSGMLPEERAEVDRAREKQAAAAAAAAAATQPVPAGAETGAQAAEAAEAERHTHHGAVRTLHDAEETLERKAAAGVLGGPMVWGLLVLAALIIIWFLLT